MKNMDLDIVLPSTNNLFPVLKQWEPPEWLSQTQGTEVTCRLCLGGKMNIVKSEALHQNILKYCLACHGTGKITIWIMV